jgi:hypothetical protein
MISRKEPVDIEYATTVSTMSAAAHTYGPDAQWVRNVLDRGEAARQPGTWDWCISGDRLPGIKRIEPG